MSLLPRRITQISAGITIAATDDVEIIDVTGQSGTVTIVMPSVADVAYTRSYFIRDAGGLAGTYNIIIDGASSETINGATTYTITNPYGGIEIFSKGTSWGVTTSNFPRRGVPVETPVGFATITTDSTASALTYTAAQCLGGMILRDPNGSGRSDVTPTAALLVAGVARAVVGTAYEFTIRNTADAAETITVTAGSGVTLSGTMTIAQNASRRFLVVFTNVTASSEAVTIYSNGAFTH